MTKGNFFQKRHLSQQNISMLSHAAEQWAEKVFLSFSKFVNCFVKSHVVSVTFHDSLELLDPRPFAKCCQMLQSAILSCNIMWVAGIRPTLCKLASRMFARL